MDIQAELILYSKSFPVELVYNEIGIPGECCETHEIVIYKTISGSDYVKEPESSITYTSKKLQTIYVSEAVDDLCNLLTDKLDIIKKMIDKYGLSAQFCITINLTDNPEIIFSNNFIKISAKLNASITIDSYVDIEKTIVYDDSDLTKP